ncbi:MAG: NAD-binding protein [Candidatus Heimdallarchaeota archaeon]|nr:NAD-binding protein [Candidatus Heimdallarchaeota archaeon]
MKLKETWVDNFEFDEPEYKRPLMSRLFNFLFKPVNSMELQSISILLLLTFVLGFTGYREYFKIQNIQADSADIIYELLRLFLIEASLEGPVPILLNIARFLAPVIAFYTGIKTLISIFEEQLQVLRLQYAKNHVIICGLGDKGFQLAHDFTKGKYTVVVIDIHDDTENILTLKDRGGIFIHGNASDESLLLKLRIQYAKYIISTLADDETNIEVATRAKKIIGTDPKEGYIVKILIHIKNIQLYNNLMTIRSFYESSVSQSYSVEFFNIYRNSARLLLLEYPFERYHLIGKDSDEPWINDHIKIVLVGWNDLTEELILQMIRQYHFPKMVKLSILLICADAESKLHYINSEYTFLHDLVNLEGMELFHENRVNYQFLQHIPKDLSAIVITEKEETTNLSISLKLYDYYRSNGILTPIFINLYNIKGLVNFFDTLDIEKQEHPRIIPFGLLNRVCGKNLVVHETLDGIAKHLHNRYYESMIIAGKTKGETPAMQPWDRLPNYLKDANIYLADHIAIKLRSLKLGLSREVTSAHKVDQIYADNDQLMLLGTAEHNRWMVAKLLEGWQKGEVRDDTKKIMPSLIPWDDLSDEEKNKDLDFIIHLPRILEEMDFIIVKS